MLSRPVGVEWAGWKTDTRRLQSCGWQLAVECDPITGRYRLAMKHEQMKLYAISNHIELRNTYLNEPWHMSEVPAFVVKHVAANFQVVQMIDDLSCFQPIDAQPQYVDTPIRGIEDYNIFAPLGKLEQVLVDKADMSVVDHLEAIKKLQSNTQRELREKERARPKLIAQLVSYEEVA
jgi:hypothetical protein